jgi:predicted RNase H-like nuclease
MGAMAIDAVLAGLIAAWRWRWGPAAAVVFGGFLPAAWRRAYFQIPPERVVELGTQLEI